MEEHVNLIDTFAEFKESKSIDRETLMHILEDVFRAALVKKYGPDAQFDIIVNVDRGDLEIQHTLEIVEDGEETLANIERKWLVEKFKSFAQDKRLCVLRAIRNNPMLYFDTTEPPRELVEFLKNDT